MGTWWDLVFPKKCLGCGKTGSYVCDKCEIGMWEEEQICPVCERRSKYGLRHSLCKRLWSMDGLICFWAYEGMVKQLINKAKHRFYFDFLEELVARGVFLTEDSKQRLEYIYLKKFIKTKPKVVPVPLHPKRELERGFNQSKVMAEVLCRYWELEECDLLKRIKYPDRRIKMTREGRAMTVNRAFEINKSNTKIKIPETVLLADDLWITGATLRECCRALKRAGVKKVWGIVLAR